MNTICLDGVWELSCEEKGIKTKATVPGCFHTDLLNAGIIDDPFYRDNEYNYMWLTELDFVYEREFDVPEKFLIKDKVMLEFDGLDTLASVYVNNQLVAKTENMHRRYAFDVKEFLTSEYPNIIKIVFDSVANYCKERAGNNRGENPGDSLPGSEQVRKAMYQWGWDWGPKIPTAGIWRSVQLSAYETAKIEDVIIDQTHNDGHVDLTIKVTAANSSERFVKCNVDIIAPDGSLVKTLKDEMTKECILHTTIENPHLWFPASFGEQPLYTVKVSLIASEIDDEKSFKIGLRELEIVQDKDKWGRTFYISVNGIPIFAKGGDYIPCDQFPSRVTEEHYREILTSTIEANMNSIRIWGGGIYESDIFYEICDELGILVWQDFMYACAHYPMTENMIKEYVEEAKDNVKRLRHHPSIALWCGNNEMEWFLYNKWPKPDNDEYKEDFEKLFYNLIARVCEREDPARTYIPASPFSEKIFDDPNGENSGDSHYWDVWHGKKPFTAYRDYFCRFMSEFGFQSLPSVETLKPVTLPEDRVMFSRIMDCHQKNPAGNDNIMFYLGKNHKLPDSFERLIYISQILHGDAMRYGVEHWRRNRNDFRCMGALYWQLNDCWQVASWASLEYDGQWKACHYMAKEFFKPILLSIEETETEAHIHITNDTIDDFKGAIEYSVWNTEGDILFEEQISAQAKPLSNTFVKTVDMTSYLKENNKYKVFIVARLLDVDDIEKTAFFAPAKYMELEKANVTIKAENNALIIETNKPIFYAQVYVPDTHVRFNHNFFPMMPNKKYIVEVSKFDNLSINEIAQKAVVNYL